MTWKQIRGTAEVAFLKETEDFYQEIAKKHDVELAKMEEEWKKIPEGEDKDSVPVAAPHSKSVPELEGQPV